MKWALSARWPLTTVLPLAVSATILLVSLTATIIGVMLLKNYVNDTLEQKAAVFLDGFAGHIAPTSPFDPDLTRAALRNALEYQSTMGESSTTIGRIDKGRLQIHSHPEQDAPAELRATLENAIARGPGASVFSFQHGERARLTKVYERNGQPFVLSTQFDAGDALRTNEATIWIAIAINATLALVAIAITFEVTRRIAIPLRAISQRLAPADDGEGPRRSELAGLESALALREQSEAIRSRAMQSMAQAERDAALARVAAVIAHEVRNPLAGIFNALATIRRYGDNRAVRDETLDIVERGLKSLERIASVTLASYRRRDGTKWIKVSDLQDLELLIAPEARQKALRIVWHHAGEDAFRADADAIRQIMLNLLLNACKASPAQGTIDVAIAVDQEVARLSVSDQGPGMPDAIVEYLRAAPPASALPPSRALGISVICALIEDIGAQISVESRADEGTTITLSLALDRDAPAEPA